MFPLFFFAPPTPVVVPFLASFQRLPQCIPLPLGEIFDKILLFVFFQRFFIGASSYFLSAPDTARLAFFYLQYHSWYQFFCKTHPGQRKYRSFEKYLFAVLLLLSRCISWESATINWSNFPRMFQNSISQSPSNGCHKITKIILFLKFLWLFLFLLYHFLKKITYNF